MIIIQVAGGLGNQLQQYALYQKFLTLGIDARLDISWFTQSGRQENVLAKRKLELDFLENLEYKACTEEEKQQVVGNGSLIDKIKGKIFPGTKKIFQETEMYHPEIFEFRDKYLCGYWACEKYYADIEEQLREKIKFPLEGKNENLALSEQIGSVESVSVHIRRGDYLDAENQAMFGDICTEEYYAGAIREMKQIYPDAHFYVFSDDTDYVREKYNGKEFSVVDINSGRDSFYDIWLMSRCRHNICANSTFSFWGARLNRNREKVMIRPWIHKNSQRFEPERMHGLWEGWILMNNRGLVV